MSELETLKKLRQRTKANVTRIKKLISPSMPLAELDCHLSLVEDYFKQLLTVQTHIEEISTEDTARAEIENLCIKTKSKIIELLGDNYKRQGFETSFALPVTTHSKLPKLDLPTFNGKYSMYKNFISSFKQFVENDTTLSNIEKFNHLLHCLSGPALDTVGAFQVTADNYEKALKRLEDRYDNKTLIFMEHIQNLYDLPNVNKPSGVQLRSLVDNASAIYGSLKSLGTAEDMCSAMIIHLISQKADIDTQIKWKENLDFSKLPSWEEFCKNLERRCQFLESSESRPSYSGVNNNNQPKRHTQRPQNYRSSFHTQQKSCSLCKCFDHWLSGCSKFRAMSSEVRFETVKKLGLCINCFSEGHVVSKCSSKNKCKDCHKSHHTMLHRTTTQHQSNHSLPSDLSNTPSSSSLTSSSSSFVPFSSHAIVNVHMEQSSKRVILATAVILVADSLGEFKLCRALLDSCSQVNLITDNLAKLLNLRRWKTSMNILGVGFTSTNMKFETNTTIRSRLNGNEYPLRLYITNRVSGHLPDMALDIQNWNLPANINLADERFNESQQIDMLIGADSFFEILGARKIKLGLNLPILQETCFGYVVSGSYKTKNNNQQLKSYATTLNNNSDDDNLSKQLELLWALEKISSISTNVNEEHQVCESHFVKNVEVLEDGRIQVRLPFKDDPSQLGSSYNLALKRFQSLEKRLNRDHNTKQQYIQFMKEYENLGHMTKVEPDFDKPHFYLPHQYVLKPNSETTKLRVVFDASAKTSSMKSLNDILCIGSNIQDELFLLLIRFRLFKYALTADIAKMYRMVLLNPSHRPLQQILWRENVDQPISTYQLNTVTYGMSSSPYLAIRSLHFLADRYKNSYKIGSNTIKTQFYVDDMLTGADDIETLLQIKEETTTLLKQGGFELTKFKSNNPSLQLEENQNKNMNINHEAITSALGITWNSTTDNFLFAFQPKKQYAVVTKRAILSLVSSIFDPMGLGYPIVIQPRVLLQDLWITKIDWDSEVPEKTKISFLNFIEDLNNLHILKVPRYVLQPNLVSLQLHGFCDASIRAYGCCVYARSTNEKGEVLVNLITSKCRVAPTKKKTMPQLELCGAHLLSKLYSKISPVFEKFQPETFLWSDSTVVLQWLNKHSSTLVTFVGNRVSEIQEETSNCTWRHVPTSSNPADILSRGCSVSELASSIWYSGPAFLKQTSESWPKTHLPVHDKDVDSAIRKTVLTCQTIENLVLNFVNRTSSYNKILRVICWLFRFHYKNKSSQITTKELQRAVQCAVWTIQQQHFSEEFRILSQGQQVKNSLKTLSLFVQNVNGFPLIRVGGRLQNADIPENRKHPYLLPKDCHFVEVLVHELHVKNFHAGPKALLAFIRQNFWIVGAKDVARKTVRSCISCIRYKPKLLQQVMGDLPAERVTPARPFERCGVDFCGPIYTYLKIRGKQPYKCYVAIFVCFVTKAVHIEAVSDLSSDAFVAALKRLVGRRGLPSSIFCDNATNFIGANAQLNDLKKLFQAKSFQNNINDFCSKNFIKFNFIPPRAPHFGGIWEAAVKSAKGYLYRTLANAKMNYEELSTTLIEIEAIMNSRPISSQSCDPNDFEALTPGHFLIGGPLNAIPASTVECKEINHLQRWKRITAAKQQFWKKWSTDYLNDMIQKSRWFSSELNVQQNTLVIIHEDNVAPQKWVLGRIVATYPGRDGKVRVADVKTAKGLFRRPVHKLAILLNP